MNVFFPSRLLRLWPFLGLLCSGLQGAATDPIETIGKAAADWVRTRTETVRLESDWTSQRPILESTVSALEQRARELEDKREGLKAKTARDRDELESIETKNQATADTLKTMETRLNEMRDRLIELRPTLPPRLSAALEMPYRSITGSDLAPGERLQLTMTILNRCVQFNRMITSGDEMLTLDGEPAPRSLEVIYWGLSHGYALDRTGGKAWCGSPGPQGWHWEARPEVVRQVARLIAVYNGKADPEFVAVPVQLAHVGAESRKN